MFSFLQENYGYQNLANKIKKYCQKVEHIQMHCKEHQESQKTRQMILEHLYDKTKKKVQMRLFKEKKVKLEKKLREIKPEIAKNIVHRYERFC